VAGLYFVISTFLMTKHQMLAMEAEVIMGRAGGGGGITLFPLALLGLEGF
jgi:hypothetical protein